jgi:hypothetical protein
LVSVKVRGQEFDQVLAPAGITRIINHDASHSDTLCFDLREREETVLMGVKAKDGSLEFTVWLEITLDYRAADEPSPVDEEELQALGTPIVHEPLVPPIVHEPLEPAPPPVAVAAAAAPAHAGAAPASDPEGRPFVSVRAKSKLAETRKRGSKVTFTRTGDTDYPLFVGYSVGGTAENGVDFAPLVGSLEIPAGKRSAKLVIRPIADGAVEGPETIELELLPDYGYARGPAARATIELLSKDR